MKGLIGYLFRLYQYATSISSNVKSALIVCKVCPRPSRDNKKQKKKKKSTGT